MLKNKLIIFLIFYISITNQKLIKNGVYNIVSNDLYLKNHNNTLKVSKKFGYPNTFIRIVKTHTNYDENYYLIELIVSNLKLRYLEKNNIIFSDNKDNFDLWNIIETSNDNFVIKNINNCFIKIYKLNVFCVDINIELATKFKLINIYFEVNKRKQLNNIDLINKEPVDILIKYIDLQDPNLKRNNIHQIEKDFDNEELRYSIRSILTNIPWIRKIFILMPNEKVRYFKEYNIIKEKIVYVKDRDLLGYESSNTNAFLFRYWKMKKFGISDNIIVMDDDYFIGEKILKSDFFQIMNGKVVPSIITSNFEKIDRDYVQKNKNIYELKAKLSKEEQNIDIFRYSKYLTYSFIFDIFNIGFNKSIFLPKFSHNAIPMNLNDIKDVYDLAYKSKYKYTTMDCIYRHYEYLQFQILVVSYIFLKYGRKVTNIPSKFIELNQSISANYNYKLFCINKGSGYYPKLNLQKAKIVMEHLFPHPSIYEIFDYSLFNFAFSMIKTLEKKLKVYEVEKKKLNNKNDLYTLQLIQVIIFLLILFKIINYFLLM